MARIDKTRLNGKAEKMEDAWKEGAPDIKFMGRTLPGLTDLRAEIRDEEQEVEDLLAQAAIKQKNIDGKYLKMEEMMVDVANGVRGNEDYGDDSPLYGAMGFVMKSERKSGLTRKSKKPLAKKDDEE